MSSCEKVYKQHLKALDEILRHVFKERMFDDDEDDNSNNNSYNQICQPSSSNLVLYRGWNSFYKTVFTCGLTFEL